MKFDTLSSTLTALAPADEWECLASGVTNVDGRIGDLLPPADSIPAGQYRMNFDTGSYMARCHAEHPGFYSPAPFYPRVHVHFQIAPGQVRSEDNLVAWVCNHSALFVSRPETQDASMCD